MTATIFAHPWSRFSQRAYLPLKRRHWTAHPILLAMGARLWGLILAFSCSSFAITIGGVANYKDVEYSRANGVPLTLDAAVPRAAGLLPAVIIVHGGAWVRGDRIVDVQPLFEPLTQAGFAWFSISYRLMSQISQFGAAIQDVQAAIRFVKSHATQYRIDPAKVALVGESAGGQLAAMAALSQQPDLRVRAVVALYTPTDLVSLAENSTFVPRWVHDTLQSGAFARMLAARLKQLSPIDNVRRDMPPFLFIHGTADPLVPFAQSQSMCRAMKTAGANCELYAVQGAGHGIRWWSPELSEGYQREMIRWLREELSYI